MTDNEIIAELLKGAIHAERKGDQWIVGRKPYVLDGRLDLGVRQSVADLTLELTPGLCRASVFTYRDGLPIPVKDAAFTAEGQLPKEWFRSDPPLDAANARLHINSNVDMGVRRLLRIHLDVLLNSPPENPVGLENDMQAMLIFPGIILSLPRLRIGHLVVGGDPTQFSAIALMDQTVGSSVILEERVK